MTKIPPLVEESKRQRLRSLILKPAYIVSVAAMGLAGATEISISQWISAFADRGLGIPKIVGDLGGLCLFAAMMGLGRTWFGLYGQKISIYRLLMGGAILSTAAYLVASLSPWAGLSLAACVLAGLGVSLLWPGLLSLTAGRFPLAGASMFALLSASGDTGAAVAPWLVGAIADRAYSFHDALSNLFTIPLSPEQLGLRSGLLFATVYPILMLFLIAYLWTAACKESAAPDKSED